MTSIDYKHGPFNTAVIKSLERTTLYDGFPASENDPKTVSLMIPLGRSTIETTVTDKSKSVVGEFAADVLVEGIMALRCTDRLVV